MNIKVKNNLNYLPEIFGLLFALIVLSLVVYLTFLLASEPIVKLSDYIQLLVLLVIASALGVSVHVQRKKEELDESNIYLEKSIDLINKAYDVLQKDDLSLKSNRVSWVTSARLISRSLELSRKIKLQSHELIFESEHDFQRHRFNDLLKKNGKNLPVEFFLGDSYIPGSVAKSAFSTISKNNINWLPEDIISEIYRFKTYPKGYEDPLDNTVKLTEEELDRLRLFDERGICDYFIFREHFYPISGKLKYYSHDGEVEEVSEKNISEKLKFLS